MINKLKTILSKLYFLFVSLSITSFTAYSYFNSNNFSTHELLSSKFHGFLFSSQINDHHDSHDKLVNARDDHVHKHRHSKNEEEHSHKHLNVISFSEIIINKIIDISFPHFEIQSTKHSAYNLKSYNSYILEILKPPIHT